MKNTRLFPIQKAPQLPRFTIHKYGNLDTWRKKNRSPRGKTYLRIARLEHKKFWKDLAKARDYLRQKQNTEGFLR